MSLVGQSWEFMTGLATRTPWGRLNLPALIDDIATVEPEFVRFLKRIWGQVRLSTFLTSTARTVARVVCSFADSSHNGRIKFYKPRNLGCEVPTPHSGKGNCCIALIFCHSIPLVSG